jgi:hypothetical protein
MAIHEMKLEELAEVTAYVTAPIPVGPSVMSTVECRIETL